MRLRPQKMTKAVFIHFRQQDSKFVRSGQGKENRCLRALISKEF